MYVRVRHACPRVHSRRRGTQDTPEEGEEEEMSITKATKCEEEAKTVQPILTVARKKSASSQEKHKASTTQAAPQEWEVHGGVRRNGGRVLTLLALHTDWTLAQGHCYNVRCSRKGGSSHMCKCPHSSTPPVLKTDFAISRR